MREVTINKNSAGQRLDKFMGKMFKTMPVTLMYKYIRKNCVKVNGKKVNEAHILNEGDVLTMYISEEFFSVDSNMPFIGINPSLNIRYEDVNLLIVDKKPGMIVHSDEKEETDTLINQIKAYLYNKNEYNPQRENSFAPALCNRIDRNTSGLVIAAKNNAALREMNDIIKNREVKKTYLAAVHGFFNEKTGRLVSLLEKNSEENKVYLKNRYAPGVKTAVLEYELTAVNKVHRLSLLKINLMTGRTHQIRVQMAGNGHPLLGDGKYSVNKEDRRLGYKSQALCSYSLEFDLKNTYTELGYINGLYIESDKPDFLKLFPGYGE